MHAEHRAVRLSRPLGSLLHLPLMALTINTSTEQKKLTQTPLLKIWVPWMGCNLSRRRGCKCGGKRMREEEDGGHVTCSALLLFVLPLL